MANKITPPLILFIIGIVGLLFSWAQNTMEIMSKIPLTILFVAILCLGIYLQANKHLFNDDGFGEREGKRGFG